ncbi:hypothetical protein PtrSN002B_006569 [Pyrenophora tritici-repentis]|nr:hypothetical protein PtrV1_08690 [Pyrenophora tritici-repentis]KAF7449731.1 hypothetical protein A1F99_067800 [Pyrenophora tritici-repentis]KAI0588917.1 hypothetical protein Alg215_00581 [Pyrenophora tritici-repentis]KAI0591319.1 hypothetical protein Alg130_01384 [Pyrenophora tritici-repentis]KAI0627151.1 hypothetical protein TUN199_00868 [Pyrenophora tritici-repentis]
MSANAPILSPPPSTVTLSPIQLHILKVLDAASRDRYISPRKIIRLAESILALAKLHGGTVRRGEDISILFLTDPDDGKNRRIVVLLHNSSSKEPRHVAGSSVVIATANWAFDRESPWDAVNRAVDRALER